jgi:hypothetical protein
MVHALDGTADGLLDDVAAASGQLGALHGHNTESEGAGKAEELIERGVSVTHDHILTHSMLGTARGWSYRAAMLLLTLLLACHTKPTVLPDDSGLPPGDSEPQLEALLTVAPAFDPLLGGPLSISTVALGAESTTVTILDADGVAVASVTDAWDGRDDAGAWLPTGTYTVSLEATLGTLRIEERAPVRMVRCGALGAWAEGDDGVSATHVPLYWHVSRTVQGTEIPFTQAPALEDEHGAPVQLDAPDDNLDIFPEGAPVPVGFTWDSQPILTLTLGDSSTLGSSGLPGSGVRVEVDGWSPVSGADDLDPTTPVVLQADEPLGTGPGVLDETLYLRFLVDDDHGNTWEIGEQELPVRWYLLLDRPAFDRPEDPYNAWVAAIDPALRAIDGVEPSEEAVLDALVGWIYNDLGLAYDTRYGASYFTNYQSGWTPAVFELSAFLRPDAGRTVNCSDCASILSTWANMLGAPLVYSIVLQNFDLNYILAIGGDTYSHCPFGSWGCSFSYHAVTTNDGGATIWDATLALDGDANPSSSPSELLMVEGIDADEYLDRLVMSGRASINYQGETLLQ